MERENLILTLKESDQLLYNVEEGQVANYEGTSDEGVQLETAIALKMSNRMIKKLLNDIDNLQSRLDNQADTITALTLKK